MKNIIKKYAGVIDIIILPFVYVSALFMRIVRRIGVQRLPLSKKVLLQRGVFPITNHYYEPLFDTEHLTEKLSKERTLPGIDLNVDEQLSLLDSFKSENELSELKGVKEDDLEFAFNNTTFESGDAEYWYNLIRLKKPKRIIEIGSGNSTLLAIKSIQKNKEDDTSYDCEHICIEPYEMPWLEKSGVTVIRELIENVDLTIFEQLGENDILFIDSSHIIRPQGDVLVEYLQILPRIKNGVIVHIHDIFTPRDYLKEWIVDEVKFWNEQYLLEAFLTENEKWKIIGALNYLHHDFYEELNSKCIHLDPSREPGSFYIQRK